MGVLLGISLDFYLVFGILLKVAFLHSLSLSWLDINSLYLSQSKREIFKRRLVECLYSFTI